MSRRRKTFFAVTLEAALGQARRELGPEALLLEAGPAAPEEAAAGAYRVVCEAGEEARAEEANHSREWRPAADPSWDEIGLRLARVERTLEAVAGSIATLDPRPGAAALQAELAAHDFPADLALRLLSAAGERLARSGDGMVPDAEAALRRCLLEELAERIRFAAGAGGRKRPHVVLCVGPPGSGKSATLVKLALREGLAKRKSAAILSTDSHRVAADEQLRTCAAILGLPFALAETASALREAAAEFASRDLILVDTPGFSRNERDWALEWARLAGALPERQTLLVLPATWRTADLVASVGWWSPFRPSALVFTRLDETGCCGGWAAAAMEASLPVAYFGTGQRIPEDLEPASARHLYAALAGGRLQAAAGGGR